MHADTTPLLAVNCSRCGRPTVTTPLSVRPDLCHPCFVDHIAAGED